jgi:hypothetical protein
MLGASCNKGGTTRLNLKFCNFKPIYQPILKLIAVHESHFILVDDAAEVRCKTSESPHQPHAGPEKQHESIPRAYIWRVAAIRPEF